MRRLTATEPDKAAWQHDVAVSLEKIGDARAAAGERAAALAAYEESLAITRRLAAADPGNADLQRAVNVGVGKLGDVRRPPATARQRSPPTRRVSPSRASSSLPIPAMPVGSAT